MSPAARLSAVLPTPSAALTGSRIAAVSAFARHATALSEESGLEVAVDGPEQQLPLARTTQTQLYGIGREALANVLRHSGATGARVSVEAST